MATSPSAVSGLPAGYTLEQPAAPAPQAAPSGLPAGYTLETGNNTAQQGGPSSDVIAAAMKPRSELSDTEKQSVDNALAQNTHDEANSYGKSMVMAAGGLGANELAGATKAGLTALSPYLAKGSAGVAEWAAAHPTTAKLLREGLLKVADTALGTGVGVAIGKALPK